MPHRDRDRNRVPHPHDSSIVVRVGTAFALIALGAGSSLALAQGANAALSGIVTDAAGARLAHAQITVQGQQTGLLRHVETNATGAYTLPELSPGTYTLRIESPGFAGETDTGIVLTVGEQRTRNARLVPGTIQADVQVQANTLSVETISPELSGVTEERAIEQLPLNGRDTIQLAVLTPGVAPSRRANGDSQGNGRQISIEGRRPNQLAFLLDGTDVNDAYNNTPGSAAGGVLGVDAISQFRVLSNGYGAAYGRSAGGVLNELTKAGTNDLHGTAFSFVRNSAADAKNYFDSAAAPIPRFQRNQFGGALGGPIRRDRLFFFANYESLRQRLGTTGIAIVPNATARATAAASVVPYLALIPLPNAQVYTDGTGQYRTTSTTSANEDYGLARVDAQTSGRTQLFARYLIDSSEVVLPDSLLLSANRTNTRNQYTTAQLTHSFTERLTNSLRLSVNRSFFTLNFDYLKPIDPTLSFVPGRPFGQISITGLAPIGPQRFGPTLNALNLFEGSDDLTWTIGRHVLSAGVDEKQILYPQQAPQSQNGFYLFNSVSTFLRAQPTSVEVALPGSIARRHWRQHMDAAWITDTIRVRSSLELTAGLRYERTSVPRETDGLQSMLRDPLHDTAATGGPIFTNPSNANLMPRVGFAYAPGAASGAAASTSLRGAFGVYFDPLWTDFYLNAGARQPPFFNVGTVARPTFPNPQITPANFIPGRIDVLQYHPASPYVLQWNTSIQQEIRRNLRLTLAYSANRGVHDTRIVDENQAIPQIVDGRKFFPANSTVRNPAFTAIRYKETNGLSSYNALLTTLEYRRGSALQLRGTYTWSKALDTGSLVTAQGTDNDVPQDPDSLRAEKGLSNYDLRHYFAGYIIATIPQLCRSIRLCSGWQTNLIAIASSGNPFSVLVSYDSARARFGTGPSPERPDLIPGHSANPVLGGSASKITRAQRYFDPASFALPAPGFYGNLPRNTLIGPGLLSIDMALNKTLPITERLRLQLRSELFNVPNHPNFAIPSQRNVFSPAGPVASAGLITQTLTTSRQLQLGARLEF